MGLNSLHSVALSGMRTAMQRLGSASHNIANWRTDGYRRELASTTMQVGGAVTMGLSAATGPGNALADDVVAQRVALYEFKANMQVVQTQQDMLGTLLDLRA